MEGEESDRKMERGCGAILSGSMFVLRFRHNDTKSLFPKSSSRRTQNHHRFLIIRARCSNGKSSTSSSPSFVSLGIPSLDESYLPRCIGLGFVSLILLNHFLPSSNVTPAQLVHRSVALGICLVAFSTSLPYLGRCPKGVIPVDCSSLPEGNKQILEVIKKKPKLWCCLSLTEKSCFSDSLFTSL